MSPLDLERKRVELLQVSTAKAALKLRILESLEEIERVKKHISVSEAKEIELTQLIKDAEKDLEKTQG